MIWFLSVVIALLLALLGVCGFYLWRFIGYIMIIEDDLGEAVEVHNRTVETFEQLLNMRLFFDSPEVKRAVQDILDDVKVCKLATQKVADNFTRLSKNKYVILIEESTTNSDNNRSKEDFSS